MDDGSLLKDKPRIYTLKQNYKMVGGIFLFSEFPFQKEGENGNSFVNLCLVTYMKGIFWLLYSCTINAVEETVFFTQISVELLVLIGIQATDSVCYVLLWETCLIQVYFRKLDMEEQDEKFGFGAKQIEEILFNL